MLTTKKLVFGIYDLGELEIEIDDTKISIERKPRFFIYRRERKGELVEKKILSKSGRIVLNPVEPVNVPKNITNYLQIKFRKPLIMEPNQSETLYTTFPVEIGVFVTGMGGVKLVDVFSFVNPKYSLYGNPVRGLICRFWESDLTQEQRAERFREGIMKLKIVNTTKEWIEVSNAVFNVQLMKIYYDKDTAATTAEMDIQSRMVAETKFLAEPLRKGMKKAVEIFSPRKVMARRFFMEWGV